MADMPSPAQFGPYFWGTLHLACLGGGKIKDLVEAFPSALPCPTCSSHFSSVIRSHPFPDDMENPIEVFKWSVDVHNAVNKRLGKPNVSYNDAFDFWTRPIRRR
jgi:hypothetical protein